MNKIIPFILAIVLLLSFSLAATGDIPSPPHRFKGFVIDQTGELIADNSNVSAVVNGVYYNTTTKDGKYGYTLLTEEFLVEGSEGDTIYFYINGIQTSQTTIFTQGGLNINFAPFLNLSLDTSSPNISSVTVTSITSSSAVIMWITNKSANSTVNYGTSIDFGDKKEDSNFIKNHEIALEDLQETTTYYFEVISYDYSGNKATDNNSENYYSFETEEQSPAGGNGDSPEGGGGTQPQEPIDNPPEDNIPPIADANGPYYGIAGQTVYFDATNSSDEDGYIVDYTWDFGDGSTNSTDELIIIHSYSDIKNYTIILTVTDNTGATNSTTTVAYISSNDSDGDGWSDDSELYYNTDPYNESDFPLDSDNDKIPDSLDSDDDNDGLTDDEEKDLGADSKNSQDVLRITNDYGLFFLIDSNADGTFDKYYDKSTKITSNLLETDEGTFLIDINNDGVYEYVYDLSNGTIILYEVSKISKEAGTLTYVYLIIAILIILGLLLFIFKIRRRDK